MYLIIIGRIVLFIGFERGLLDELLKDYDYGNPNLELIFGKDVFTQ